MLFILEAHPCTAPTPTSWKLRWTLFFTAIEPKHVRGTIQYKTLDRSYGPDASGNILSFCPVLAAGSVCGPAAANPSAIDL
jgi:hypothetical protein